MTNICTFCKEQGDQPKGMDPIDQKFAVLKKTLVDLILCKEDDAYVIRNPMEETALVYKTGVEVDLKEALGTMKPSERNVKPYYISGKLITLLTSLNTLLKRCSGELLYVLCDNDGKCPAIEWLSFCVLFRGLGVVFNGYLINLLYIC